MSFGYKTHNGMDATTAAEEELGFRIGSIDHRKGIRRTHLATRNAQFEHIGVIVIDFLVDRSGMKLKDIGDVTGIDRSHDELWGVSAAVSKFLECVASPKLAGTADAEATTGIMMSKQKPCDSRLQPLHA